MLHVFRCKRVLEAKEEVDNIVSMYKIDSASKHQDLIAAAVTKSSRWVYISNCYKAFDQSKNKIELKAKIEAAFDSYPKNKAGNYEFKKSFPKHLSVQCQKAIVYEATL